MSDEKNPPVRIPEDANAAVGLVEEETDEELDEQKRNLVRAQSRLIGDTDPE